MTRRLFAVMLALVMAATACGDDDAGGGGAVSIDSPASGTQVAAGTSLTVQVTATDDAGVSRIDLQYAGQTVLSITNNAGSNPFVAVQSWAPTQPGSSNLVAVAYRADGSVIGSAQVAMTVTGDAVTTTTTADETDTTGTTTAGGTGTTAGGTGTTAGGTGTTAGGTGTTAGTTSTTAGTTTTAGGEVAPDDGGDGTAPPEYTIRPFAKNSQPEAVVFEGEISNPGDRGDGIKIIVENLFNGTNSDQATVSLQFICDPGGPRVRTSGFGPYSGGSECDFTYTTTFEVGYQSNQRTYYIFVPDGVEGYFEYTLLVTATRH